MDLSKRGTSNKERNELTRSNQHRCSPDAAFAIAAPSPLLSRLSSSHFLQQIFAIAIAIQSPSSI